MRELAAKESVSKRNSQYELQGFWVPAASGVWDDWDSWWLVAVVALTPPTPAQRAEEEGQHQQGIYPAPHVAEVSSWEWFLQLLGTHELSGSWEYMNSSFWYSPPQHPHCVLLCLLPSPLASLSLRGVAALLFLCSSAFLLPLYFHGNSFAITLSFCSPFSCVTELADCGLSPELTILHLLSVFPSFSSSFFFFP